MISLTFGGVFDPDKIEYRLKEQEAITAEPEFWNNREDAEKVLAEIKKLHRVFDPWKELHQGLSDLKELYELAVGEDDQSMESEIRDYCSSLQKRYEDARLLQLLSDEYDENDAFLTIHSGAGGTEACDWVSMLYRMYTRWIEKQGYKLTLLDMLEAEGGIKSVTIQIKGEFAHGKLKGESGIHRLVRISPFDSAKRRHTSFASVHVSPVIDDSIEVDIRPDEIRVDTYRAQGAGGQHVNTTDSAVRITHLETGLVVQCQNERSQHKNKATAMKILQSRLFEYYKEKQNEEREQSSAEKKDISWGNQIRSYVFHPYNMVKDLRTRHETGNTGAVMDGDLDMFIESYLQFYWESKQNG